MARRRCVCVGLRDRLTVRLPPLALFVTYVVVLDQGPPSGPDFRTESHTRAGVGA